MATFRVPALTWVASRLNSCAPIQLRVVIATALLLTVCPQGSFGQQLNAATDGQVKQLAYDFPWGGWHPGWHWEAPATVIYVRNGPGLKSKKLLETAKLPKWSPDGQKLAFLALFCRAGGGIDEPSIEDIKCIEIANADGSHRIRLTDHPKTFASAVNLAWSPSGDEIAYLERDERNQLLTTVAIVGPDGSGRKEIQNLQCPATMADYGVPDLQHLAPMAIVDWSPDGQSIAFTGCSSDGPVVMVADRAGEGAHVVAEGYGALWSPDGRMLLFRKTDSLWLVNADGTQERKVLDGELAMLGLSWLPSGRGIAFASARNIGAVSEIFRINIDGTGIQKVASGAREGLSFASPVFSPDEEELIVVSDACLRCLLDHVLPENPRTDIEDGDSPPAVLLIDLVTSRQERLAKGSRPSVVWDHK